MTALGELESIVTSNSDARVSSLLEVGITLDLLNLGDLEAFLVLQGLSFWARSHNALSVLELLVVTALHAVSVELSPSAWAGLLDALSIDQLESVFTLGSDASLGRWRVDAGPGAEHLVASGSSEDESALAADSLALVNTFDLDKLGVLTT